MMTNLRSKKILFLTGIFIIVIVTLHFLPVKIPYRIKVPGKIIPAREWVIKKLDDGSLTTVFTDHRTGLMKNYSAIQIERGDVIKFKLSPVFFSETFVHEGDTIGFVQSSEVDFQLIQLNRELEFAKYSLKLNMAGEKEELVKEARERVELAVEILKIKSLIAERQDSLYQRELISGQECEISSSEKQVAQIELSLAKKSPQVVLSGAKSEQIDLFKSEIETIKKEIGILKKRKDDLSVISPLSGKILKFFSSDTLMIIGDTTSIVIMPVKITHLESVAVAQNITVELGNSKIITGKIFRKENDVQILNSNQIFLVIADIENNSGYQIPNNIFVTCTITLASVKPLIYLLKTAESFFN